MFHTQIFTYVAGEKRFLAREKSHRLVILQDDAFEFSLSHKDGAQYGTVCIDAPRAKGDGLGQVVPNYGRFEEGRAMDVAANTKGGNQQVQDIKRQFRPIPIGVGFYLQCVLDPTFYIGVMNGVPALSVTPAVWYIPDDDRVALVRLRAQQIYTLTGRTDAVANWYEAEKTLFSAL